MALELTHARYAPLAATVMGVGFFVAALIRGSDGDGAGDTMCVGETRRRVLIVLASCSKGEGDAGQSASCVSRLMRAAAR